MKKNTFEAIVGTVVLVIAIAFLFFALNRTDFSYKGHYQVVAKFTDVDGIFVGSDIKIGGVKIGTVTSQDVDGKTYRAIVKMNIRNDIKLPKDTSVKVATSGLIGGRYLQIQPGNRLDKLLKAGDEIRYTQSSIHVEDLISKFAFGTDKDKKEDK